MTETAGNNDANFTIRVSADLKRAFIDSAKSQDRSASVLVRDYMRDYVKQHGQTDMFGDSKNRGGDM